MHAVDGVHPGAPFKWRVRVYTVDRNELPTSNPVRLLLVVLPVRRVCPHGVRGRGGGRLKPAATFLSLLHVNVQESPPYIWTLHFGPSTFNFVFGPHFCYISFDFVRLGPPI